MFGLFKKKSSEQLAAEKALLDKKIAAARTKVQAVHERRQLIEEVAKRKKDLKQLNSQSRDNLMARIKAKTSPALRSFERKVAEKVKTAGPKLVKAAAAIGEASYKGTQGMTGAQQRKKSNPEEVRLW